MMCDTPVGENRQVLRFATVDGAIAAAKRVPCGNPRCRRVHIVAFSRGRRYAYGDLAVVVFDNIRVPDRSLAELLEECYPEPAPRLLGNCRPAPPPPRSPPVELWPTPPHLNPPLEPHELGGVPVWDGLDRPVFSDR